MRSTCRCNTYVGLYGGLYQIVLAACQSEDGMKKTKQNYNNTTAINLSDLVRREAETGTRDVDQSFQRPHQPGSRNHLDAPRGAKQTIR